LIINYTFFFPTNYFLDGVEGSLIAKRLLEITRTHDLMLQHWRPAFAPFARPTANSQRQPEPNTFAELPGSPGWSLLHAGGHCQVFSRQCRMLNALSNSVGSFD
jgi:hypothetical protein